MRTKIEHVSCDRCKAEDVAGTQELVLRSWTVTGTQYRIALDLCPKCALTQIHTLLSMLTDQQKIQWCDQLYPRLIDPFVREYP